ncbi:MAG: hypothetical protein KGH56_00905 [Patescibacteria group bacterium]|nr:hypothetical protein [Patescibacteria group bacterium]
MFLSQRLLFGSVLLLLAANAVLYNALFTPHKPSVTVFPVGKEGRAALIQSSSDSLFLIDAGPDAGILRALGSAVPPWRHSIDAVLLTDASAKISGGLPDVLRRYHVLALLRPAKMGSRSAETSLSAAVGESPDLRTVSIPSSTRVSLGNDISVSVISTGKFLVSFGESSLLVSSSTPAGRY